MGAGAVVTEEGGDVMTIYPVKPYRGAWLAHLRHFEFRTAFCALFGIARWHLPVRPCAIIDNLGLTITLREAMGKEWQHEKRPPDGVWCWVTDGEGVWIAQRDRRAANGWTNSDTWEDFTHTVTHWILLEQPEVP